MLTKKDFEELKRLGFHGQLSGGVSVQLYWFNCMNASEAALGQTMRTHHHDFFEIHFALSGEIVYRIGEKKVTVSRGTLLVIPSGVLHTVESYTEDMLKASLSVWIDEAEPLYKGLCERGGRALPLDGAVADSLSFCAEAAKGNAPYREIRIKNRIFEMLTEIAGEFDFPELKQESGEGSGITDLRLFKAKQFLKDNPGVFVKCAELASYCGLSVKQLSRIFIRHEGTTLLKYIHGVKVETAKELLKSSDKGLSEISESLGFSSVYYFCEFFTKHVGVAPGLFARVNKR